MAEWAGKTKDIPSKLISDSSIYGIVRHDARAVIEKGISSDAEVARLVAAVRVFSASVVAAKPNDMLSVASDVSREDLRAYLTAKARWNQRDAALLVEYASLDLDRSLAVTRRDSNRSRAAALGPLPYQPDADPATSKLVSSNLGALAAIGEQRATQFFAQLASCFDKKAATKYEAIFSAWGGDVRERSVDLASGQVRPRQYTLTPSDPKNSRPYGFDPTVYARVDYLDSDAKLTAAEKSSCQAVLKNLPVVFTFAPMNLLRYQISFPAKSTCVMSVNYIQYMYTDDRGPASYQLAYVLHPASLWDHFGPIHVTIQMPKGIGCKATVPIEEGDMDPKSTFSGSSYYKSCRATLTTAKDKTGELFIGIDKDVWDKMAEAARKKMFPAKDVEQ
jgi:hypothetical protein